MNRKLKYTALVTGFLWLFWNIGALMHNPISTLDWLLYVQVHLFSPFAAWALVDAFTQ